MMATVGDNCIDHYGDIIFVGGNALNVAVQWSDAGVDSSYFGAVGSDEAGARVLSTVAARGLNVEAVVALGGNTATTHLRLGADGNRRIEHEDLGPTLDYRPSAGDIERLARTSWVHAAVLGDPEPLARALAAAGTPFSYDFSTRIDAEMCAPLAVAFYSFDEPPGHDVIGRLRRALDRGANAAVGLCGEFGSVVVDDHQIICVPAVPVQVVDTCGAGDSYIAKFALERCAGRPLEDSAINAARAAAITCTHRGAWPQEPLEVAELGHQVKLELSSEGGCT